jgi:DNA repair protein RecN (Recombination protein N)
VIEELHIRGLGVIEEATLVLAPGLTVVTGETGAGKTMLVTALELLLGARADTALVRSGADVALVEAIVSPVPPSAADWVEPGDEVLTLSRTVPSDGRSRVRIGGRLAPVSALEEVLGSHVEVHAQHEHVRLSRPDVQRALLDRFAGEGHADLVASYRTAHGIWTELVARRQRLHGDAAARAREVERLRAEVSEIDAVALDPEVDGELDTRIERLANADELHRLATTVAEAAGSEGAGDAIGRALAALRRLSVADAGIEALRDRLEALAVELADVAGVAAGVAADVEADLDGLDRLQARKRQVVALMRRYGATPSDVLAHRDAAAATLADLADLESEGGDLDERIDEAAGAMHGAGRELTAARRAAGQRLATVVDGHLADLGMPHARFGVEVETLPEGRATAEGTDTVRFVLAANPGEPARPLATAASGGERSRVALAVEVALADVDDAQVLVFDEVDAGIGGSTALAVGEKLARLAHAPTRPRQVLCVTHLAQLAAYADVHHVVEKGVVDGRTVTTTRSVAGPDRVVELSRMLGGEVTAQAGLDHARELIEAAMRRRGS